MRIYYHRGESVAVRTRELYEAGELIRALTLAATSAALAEQLQLRRNNAGQLGKLLVIFFILNLLFCANM